MRPHVGWSVASTPGCGHCAPLPPGQPPVLLLRPDLFSFLWPRTLSSSVCTRSSWGPLYSGPWPGLACPGSWTAPHRPKDGLPVSLGCRLGVAGPVHQQPGRGWGVVRGRSAYGLNVQQDNRAAITLSTRRLSCVAVGACVRVSMCVTVSARNTCLCMYACVCMCVQTTWGM